MSTTNQEEKCSCCSDSRFFKLGSSVVNQSIVSSVRVDGITAVICLSEPKASIIEIPFCTHKQAIKYLESTFDFMKDALAIGGTFYPRDKVICVDPVDEFTVRATVQKGNDFTTITGSVCDKVSAWIMSNFPEVNCASNQCLTRKARITHL